MRQSRYRTSHRGMECHVGVWRGSHGALRWAWICMGVVAVEARSGQVGKSWTGMFWLGSLGLGGTGWSIPAMLEGSR